MKNYEIVIIGAGPAGSMAAQAAAAAGKKTALIERNEKPSMPVRCGEGIGRKGLATTLEPQKQWIKSGITRARMISPSGIKVEIGNVDQSWILDRQTMDFDLVKQAVKAGADFFPSTTIVSAQKKTNGLYHCIGQDKEFTANCLILADGVESRIARCFGWDTALKLSDIETCAFARVTSPLIDQECCSFYTGGQVAPGGYAWIFPRGGAQANVGLGVIGSKCKAGLPKELLTRFIELRFPNSEVSHLHCGGVPVGRWIRPLVKEGVMLAGDAARQVNAINGAGIAYSLYAGKLAGETAAKALNKGTINHKILLKYQKQWAKNFGKQQDRSFALKEFIMNVGDGFLDRIANSLARENPEKISYLRVFTRTFATKPTLLLKAFKLFK
ncbi:MAG: NAD(P)/FAD-dependent oxidoreductase [Chitinispirillales bacterium]|jgi:digeranylgeranylglycerophospholipid reductase|nr:NAD(P)/FAD-dependent oxidoreductase [Chitinispirillales bacterium]